MNAPATSANAVESLTEQALYKLTDIIGNPKANPPTKPIIPVSRSTWERGVRNGTYPPPIYLGERTPAWRADDLKRFLTTGDWRTSEQIEREGPREQPKRIRQLPRGIGR